MKENEDGGERSLPIEFVLSYASRVTGLLDLQTLLSVEGLPERLIPPFFRDAAVANNISCCFGQEEGQEKKHCASEDEERPERPNEAVLAVSDRATNDRAFACADVAGGK
jgi:hypothetical protein